MWMSWNEFIRALKRALKDQAKFKPCRTMGVAPDEDVFFDNIPDGIYDLVVDKHNERLEVTNGMFTVNYTDVFVGKRVTIVNAAKPRKTKPTKEVKHDDSEVCTTGEEQGTSAGDLR